MIRNFVIGCFILLSQASAFANRLPAKSFEITGHLEGLRDGEKIKIGNRFADWHKVDFTDSCKAENGNFHFKVNISDGPRQYEVWLWDRCQAKAAGIYAGGLNISLFAEAGDKVIVNGDVDKVKHTDFSGEIDIRGSISDQAMVSMVPSFYKFADSIDQINKQINKIGDSVGYNQSLIEAEITKKNAIDQDLGFFLNQLPIKYKVAIPIFFCYLNTYLGEHYHGSITSDLYKSLDPAIQNSYYGKQMESYIPLSVGQVFPNFILPNVEGENISLNKVREKNKITLLHFWASNSVERGTYQQQLRFFYKKYKDRGLGIIGISADSILRKWKEAVAMDDFPWPNVSDLKGNLEGGIVEDIYHEGGHHIPNTTNVLLDSYGKIIAWDVSGVELQWYLRKLFGE